uniref:DUF4806 domain-containing protein n=1 Tax=Anopheles quadriannulatus TaxID=34691 RepID=A0A904A5Q4_ANOQN
MPYVLVKKTKSNLGRKEVAVAPSSWIHKDGKGTTYVSLPDAVCPKKIRALLEKESNPTKEWEKHECEILSTDIPTLTMAYTIIETMQKQNKVLGGRPSQLIKTSLDKTEKALPTRPPVQEAPKVVSKQKQPDKPKTLPEPVPEPDYDPFADIPNWHVPEKHRTPATSPTEDLQMTVEECETTDPLQQLFSSAVVNQEQGDEDDPFRDVSPPLKDPQMTATGEQRPPVGSTDQFFTRINKELNKQHDMLGDVSYAQLLDLLYELKCMIRSNQDELRRKINEGFSRLQQTVLSVLAKDNTNDSAAFEEKTVACKEELDALESRLQDEAYREQVHRWMDRIIASEAKPELRMTNILHKLVDNKLLAQLEWNPEPTHPEKIRLETYRQFCKLFEYAGTTTEHVANDWFVECFFRNKLKNNAHTRVNMSEKRKGVTESKPVKIARNETELNTCEETVNLLETDTVSTTNQDDDVYEIIELDGDEDNAPTTATTATPTETTEYVEVNHITSFDGMNDFEVRLKDPDYLSVVHGWIDNAVKQTIVPAERMGIILDQLVDSKFLQNFDWTGTRNGKVALIGYKNFVRLFEYAGTITPQNRACHWDVAKFFQQKFKAMK